MKKLMLAVAIVCAAAMTQAASVYWTCTYVSKGEENYVNGGLAYFVDANVLSQSSLLALAGSGADSVGNALKGFYSYNGEADSDGKYSIAKTAAIENSALGITDGTTGNSVYLVVFDTGSITDSSNFYMTKTATYDALSGTETASIKWGDQEELSSAAGAWNSVAAAPEPTSGLLLLLGMAGLALKRKRA